MVADGFRHRSPDPRGRLLGVLAGGARLFEDLFVRVLEDRVGEACTDPLESFLGFGFGPMGLVSASAVPRLATASSTAQSS